MLWEKQASVLIFIFKYYNVESIKCTKSKPGTLGNDRRAMSHYGHCTHSLCTLSVSAAEIKEQEVPVGRNKTNTKKLQPLKQNTSTKTFSAFRQRITKGLQPLLSQNPKRLRICIILYYMHSLFSSLLRPVIYNSVPKDSDKTGWCFTWRRFLPNKVFKACLKYSKALRWGMVCWSLDLSEIRAFKINYFFLAK